MDADIKAKWINALRSKQYQQTKTFLHDSGAYCCLGVLCKIQGAEPDTANWPENAQTQLTLLDDNDVSTMDYSAGLTNEQKNYLARMNDKGDNFFDIADFIDIWC